MGWPQSQPGVLFDTLERSTNEEFSLYLKMAISCQDSSIPWGQTAL
ncbi:hypothetical protein LCGC14_0058920 [marine sediment metagenome]|uniref:Uncharacterized protein n=1 Tax=marine sediment metagenome TaxID=412755 RepID=A0A0F9YRH7_9ZZZZ